MPTLTGLVLYTSKHLKKHLKKYLVVKTIMEKKTVKELNDMHLPVSEKKGIQIERITFYSKYKEQPTTFYIDNDTIKTQEDLVEKMIVLAST